jgi:hypothetical protein
MSRFIVDDALDRELNSFSVSHNIPKEKILSEYADVFERHLSKRQRSPAGNPSSLSKLKNTKFQENLVRLAPDWNRRRKLVRIRIKTMIRIYLSKWFWLGLEWYEVILLETLLSKTNLNLPFYSENRNVFAETIGAMLCASIEIAEGKKSLYSYGQGYLELGDVLDLVYTEQEFQALWKLRSVQSLRDLIFQDFTGKEHIGKKGIKKPRIRGYRDGKGSSRQDPRRIEMSLKIDQLFWEEKFHRKWDDLEDELRALSST